MSSGSSFNPNQLSVQDLVDYLHTAVSEDDLLYVSIWLSHLEERQVGSPALRVRKSLFHFTLLLLASRNHTVG
jgi:hypothetical protein